MDFPPAMYAQEIKLVFSNPQAAARARVQAEPLHDGHHRAVSCRWDDNATGNVEARRLMEKHGIRGTWYLNHRHHGSGYAGPGEEYDYLETARGLLQGGNSVGAHSLSHPFITCLHRNRMFEETAGCRVEWEASLDTPGKFSEAVKWAYGEPKLNAAGPMISNSMHAWYGSPRLEFGYDELERRLDLMADLEDVWHCNQNEYAAYRRQFRATRVRAGEPAGTMVSVHIERPSVLDLNDPVDLTLAVLGVEPDELLRVECSTTVVAIPSRPREGKLVFQLPHARDQLLPEKIGCVANPWPREGFSLLGPIPKESFDVNQIAALIATRPCPETLGLAGQHPPLKWRKNARDGFIRQDWLDPEYIRTMGTWDAASPGYVLRTKVTSPVARSVEFVCSREQIGPLFLNGKPVVDFKDELPAGENELVMIYPPDVLRVGGVRLAACFLRLADPTTGERLHDIRYRAW